MYHNWHNYHRCKFSAPDPPGLSSELLAAEWAASSGVHFFPDSNSGSQVTKRHALKRTLTCIRKGVRQFSLHLLAQGAPTGTCTQVLHQCTERQSECTVRPQRLSQFLRLGGELVSFETVSSVTASGTTKEHLLLLEQLQKRVMGHKMTCSEQLGLHLFEVLQLLAPLRWRVPRHLGRGATSIWRSMPAGEPQRTQPSLRRAKPRHSVD